VIGVGRRGLEHGKGCGKRFGGVTPKRGCVLECYEWLKCMADIGEKEDMCEKYGI